MQWPIWAKVHLKFGRIPRFCNDGGCFSFYDAGKLVVLPQNVFMNQNNHLELCDNLPECFTMTHIHAWQCTLLRTESAAAQLQDCCVDIIELASQVSLPKCHRKFVVHHQAQVMWPQHHASSTWSCAHQVVGRNPSVYFTEFGRVSHHFYKSALDASGCSKILILR